MYEKRPGSTVRWDTFASLARPAPTFCLTYPFVRVKTAYVILTSHCLGKFPIVKDFC
jgi:hypothetical protein